jgi:hypothetical protein
MEISQRIGPLRKTSPMARLDALIDRFPGAASVLFVTVEASLLGSVATVAAADSALNGNTWFDAQLSGAWVPAAALAGVVVVPAISGFLARTRVWLLMAGAAALAAVLLGTILGLILARLAYPQIWAEPRSDDWFPISPGAVLVFLGLFGGFLLAVGAMYNAAIGTALGKIRRNDAAFQPDRNWPWLFVAAVLILIEVSVLWGRS